MSGKTIGVVSIKGGVGKTTTTVNLGKALAELDHKVLLVDADFTAPNLALNLGLVKPENTLHNVFKGEITSHEAIHSYEENLDLLPCSLIADKVNPYLLKKKVEGLKKLYDYIIIDSAPTLNDEMLATIIASDELLVVTSPDYPTLSATLYAVKVAEKEDTPITGLILNKVRGKSFELTEEEIEEAAGVNVLGSVRDDLAVPSSIAETTPALSHKPRARASREFKRIAEELSGVEFEADGILDRVLDIFRR